jgi:hypothetical protein
MAVHPTEVNICDVTVQYRSVGGVLKIPRREGRSGIVLVNATVRVSLAPYYFLFVGQNVPPM